METKKMTSSDKTKKSLENLIKKNIDLGDIYLKNTLNNEDYLEIFEEILVWNKQRRSIEDNFKEKFIIILKEKILQKSLENLKVIAIKNIIQGVPEVENISKLYSKFQNNKEVRKSFTKYFKSKGSYNSQKILEDGLIDLKKINLNNLTFEEKYNLIYYFKKILELNLYKRKKLIFEIDEKEKQKMLLDGIQDQHELEMFEYHYSLEVGDIIRTLFDYFSVVQGVSIGEAYEKESKILEDFLAVAPIENDNTEERCKLDFIDIFSALEVIFNDLKEKDFTHKTKVVSKYLINPPRLDFESGSITVDKFNSLKLQYYVYKEMMEEIMKNKQEELFNEKEETEDSLMSLFDNSIFNNSLEISKPQEIKEYLDKYVKGQEKFKKTISLLAFNHLMGQKALEKGKKIKKENMLIIGPTGSGKTYSLEKLSELIKVPLVIADATEITGKGWAGDDIDIVFKKLYEKADCDKKRAESGIIYFDEIDKIFQKTGEKSRYSISYQATQDSFLKIMEAKDVKIDENVELNTGNITFILGGAFVGLEDVILNRKKIKKEKIEIGFTVNKIKEKKINKNNIDEKNILDEVTTEDLVKYGIMPELLGRISKISVLNKLNKEDLKEILLHSKNSPILECMKRFSINDIKFKFNKDVIDKIVDKVYEQNLGARGLASFINKLVEEIEYESYNNKSIKEVEFTLEMFDKKIMLLN